MTSLPMVRLLFVMAALYDGLLGVAFLVAGPRIFAHFGIGEPNHWGYVHFPAGILLIFALLFFDIALRPAANRHLIGYGILLKLCYAGVVIWHWNTVPAMWKPLALADLLFAVAFVWAYGRIRVALRRAVAAAGG